MLENLNSEMLTEVVSVTTLAMVAFGMAFSRAQKEFIKKRDNHVCQFPEPHNCNGSSRMPENRRRLQVHHIIPQRYAQSIGLDPDYVENGITLCQNAHVGPEGIHPDMASAQSKDDYQDIFDKRAELLEKRQIYWNDKWDRVFHVIVARNSQRIKAEGQIFPFKKGQQGKLSSQMT
jgi:hypothetical protein